MIIELSPVRDDAPLPKVEIHGDIVVYEGEEYDFGPLNEGDILPYYAIDNPAFCKGAKRLNGVIHLALAFPYAYGAGPDVLFPAPVDISEGPLVFPFYVPTVDASMQAAPEADLENESEN